MFGYIVGNQAAMEEEEQKRYRSFYCGLCHALGTRHGQTARMSLTYDMTFLILLLSSLYEPEERLSSSRCVIHPVKEQAAIQTRYTEYAADLSVVLTYFKCMDDWKDERKQSRRLYAKALERSCHAVQKKWPRQCTAIQQALTELARLEQSPDAILDDLARAFGRMMGELFVYQEDHWSDTLRSFGDYLGRFIYVMDAALDLDEDRKHGRYNPLAASEQGLDDMEAPLTLLIGTAAGQFERLPLVQDVSLLRNILYSGAWQQYCAERAKRTGKDDTE